MPEILRDIWSLERRLAQETDISPEMRRRILDHVNEWLQEYANAAEQDGDEKTAAVLQHQCIEIFETPEEPG